MKKFWKKEKSFKECPRCDMRNLITAEECSECGLVFSRMQFATNKDAKKKLKRKDKEFIIMTSTLPSDVSFMKLLLWCIFGGLVGAHSFYVGRYWKGILPCLSTIILIFFTIFNEPLNIAMGEQPFGALSICVGFIMIMWPIDIVLILMKKFKVPVAIDIDAKDEMEEIEAAAAKGDGEVVAADDSEEKPSVKSKRIREEVLKDLKEIKSGEKEDKREGEET